MAIASTGVVVIVGVWVIFCMNRYKTSAVWVIYGEYFTLLKELAAEVPKIKNQLIETVSLLQQQIDLMLPSMVIVGAMFLSYIVFQAVRIISEKQNVKVQIRHFYELRLNKSFTVIFLIVDLIAAGMVNNIIALNVSSVIYVIFTVCGVSVIDFYLQVMGVPTVLRVIIYIAAVVVFSLLGPIGTLIANIIYFVGMIDSFRPLRHFPDFVDLSVEPLDTVRFIQRRFIYGQVIDDLSGLVTKSLFVYTLWRVVHGSKGRWRTSFRSV